MVYTEDGRTVYYYADPALTTLTDLTFRHKKPQQFSEILTQTETHFKDDEFKRNEKSIGDYGNLFDTADPDMQKRVDKWRRHGWNGTATWFRIPDLCQKLYHGENTPVFNAGDVGKTIARNDIQQGTTGDCWFLCSVSAVTMDPALLKWIVPADNGDGCNPKGVYHFRFWYEGVWLDIVVDDYVPCVVTNDDCFTMGTNFYPVEGKAEFWPMMLEKAYAKLNRSYSNIAANCAIYALENLIGGFSRSQLFDPKNPPPNNSFKLLRSWLDRNCIACAGSNNTEVKDSGIVGDHAYSVTGCRTVKTTNGEEHNLIRLRNPWGFEEWNGDWSAQSPTWDHVDAEQKQAIGLPDKVGGEFWMSWADFIQCYSDLSTSWYNAAMTSNDPNSAFRFVQFLDKWSVSNNTAGGWDNPWQNPLFVVDVSGADSNFLVVGTLLQQKLYEKFTKYFTIRLFPAETETNFDEKYFQEHYKHEIFPVGQTSAPGAGTFTFSAHYQVPTGRYVIVPTTLKEGVTGKVVVRVCNQGTTAAFKAAPPAAGRAGSRSPSESSSGGSAASSGSDSD